jgi:RNA polymerase primary sigma factor
VVSVAKDYQGQGLPLTDLINEGNLGLIKAAKRFDQTRGLKFISYAVWWIRQSILQALADQARIVRLPLNKIGTINKISKSFSHLEQEYGRTPTVYEIADYLDISAAEVKLGLNNTGKHISMDAPLVEGDNSSSNMYDLLKNTDKQNPENGILTESLQQDIEQRQHFRFNECIGRLRSRETH